MANSTSRASAEFDITRPLLLTRSPMDSDPKTGEATVYIYSPALDGANHIRVAKLQLGMGLGLTVEQEAAFLNRLADTIVLNSLEATFAGVPEVDVTGPSFKEDEDYLLAGDGDLWEVRVCNSLDECDWVDFEVRAPTMLEAANKAEEVAGRHADVYFGEAPAPTYRADRNNIYRIEEEN